MHHSTKLGLAGCALALASAQALAQVTFYQDEGFHGKVFSTDRSVENFNSVGFNDRASSVVVERGRWEVCDDAGFGGRCAVLRPGSYDTLSGMGLNDRISSLRPVSGSDRPDVAPPLAEPSNAWRRRPDERIVEVPVTSVRAVMGTPEQRCWVEKEQVTEREQPKVGRGVLGAVIGGVIGHQIGGGTGRDLATIGGAVAGGAIGANGGRDRNVVQRDVQRCETVAGNAAPAYWDVTYDYRGVQHRLQMSAPPGATIAVNGNGEPRQ